MAARERIVYLETYAKGTALADNALPTVKHTRGAQPGEAHLLARGVIERGNEQFDFHDVRLYFKRS